MTDHAMILVKRVGQRQLMMRNERVVVDRAMIIQFRGAGAGVADAGGVNVVNSLAVDSTTVRLTFDVDVVDNAALRNPANYTFVPVLTPVAITVVSPTVVDVTVSEQLDGQSYIPTVIQTLEPA